MSEERFIYGSDKYWVKDIENNVDLFPIDVLILLNEQDEKIKELKKENEQLKERLYDFEKRKIIEESLIDEDVIPRVKLLRTELFGEKYE